jgi:hypothetical protein
LGGKYERREKKKKKKETKKGRIMEEMRLFSVPYLRRGHQFDHVPGSMGVKEIMSDHLYLFRYIYIYSNT